MGSPHQFQRCHTLLVLRHRIVRQCRSLYESLEQVSLHFKSVIDSGMKHLAYWLYGEEISDIDCFHDSRQLTRHRHIFHLVGP